MSEEDYSRNVASRANGISRLTPDGTLKARLPSFDDSDVNNYMIGRCCDELAVNARLLSCAVLADTADLAKLSHSSQVIYRSGPYSSHECILLLFDSLPMVRDALCCVDQKAFQRACIQYNMGHFIRLKKHSRAIAQAVTTASPKSITI